MIIAPGDDATEAGSSKAAVAQEDSQVPPDDPPPSYTSHPTLEGQLSPPSILSSLPKSSNLVAISKLNGSVKGSWVIDPTLHVPTSFLPPVVRNESRKSFSVSTRNGLIDIDLTVVQGNDDGINGEAKKRATIHLHSQNGAVTAKLHRPLRSLPLPRPSIFLSTSAYNGQVNLRLPRSFHGPLTVTTLHGSIRFSPDLTMAVTTFSDMRTKKCFVGDLSAWRESETWMGDEVVVESKNGSVKIQFDDEVTPEGSRGPLFGMWSRLFGT